MSHATVRLNIFEQRSLSLFIRRPTMGKTIGEPGWSVGVSAVKTLRNGGCRLRNASPHSILRINLNKCYLYYRNIVFTGWIRMTIYKIYIIYI